MSIIRQILQKAKIKKCRLICQLLTRVTQLSVSSQQKSQENKSKNMKPGELKTSTVNTMAILRRGDNVV